MRSALAWVTGPRPGCTVAVVVAIVAALADAEYVAAIRSLLDWIEQGTRPTAQGIAARCATLEAVYEPAQGCRFRPEFSPQPLASRVAPR